MSDANNARSGHNRSGGNTGAMGNPAQGQGSGASGLADTARQAQGKMTETAHEAQGAVKETAHEAMDTARETVTEMADQAQQQAGEMMSQVSDQVTTAIGDVREQATSTFTEQRDRAVTSLSALADALREAGRTLDQQRQGVSAQDAPAAAMAPFIDEAADRLAQSADFLKDKDISGLFNEAQQLARKQPGLFMASMFGIGLVGARLLKGAMDEGAGGQQQGGQSGQSGSGSGSGLGSPMKSQSWGGGATASMPSGFGGSPASSSQSISHEATTGFGAGSESRTNSRAQESDTPGAGWSVDDTNRTGEGVNTDTRLTEQPGGGDGTTGTVTGGSAASGYGTFDPNSLADEDRVDAVLGDDASGTVGRKREERS